MSAIGKNKVKVAAAPKRKTNRKAGTKKWHQYNIDVLFDHLQKDAPITHFAWERASEAVSAFAKSQKREARSADACECMYKRLRTGDPTGAGGLSPSQKRAIYIWAKVNDDLSLAVFQDDDSADDD